MTMKGQYTLAEITSQPETWADTWQVFTAIETNLKRAWATLNPKQLLFTGCGSTYYLARTAATLFQELTRIPARAYPASEIAFFAPHLLIDPAQTLLITVSRSGTTSETLAAVEQFRHLGGRSIWSITCYPQATLAQEASLVLAAEAAQEQSLAQTRSFTSMLLLAQAMAATIAGKEVSVLARLPELGRRLIGQTAALTEILGSRTDLKQFFFLGSGTVYGLACEAMLKLKEMSLTQSEAFHFLEFRHGPKSMVDEASLIVGLLSPQTLGPEQQLLNELATLKGHTLALTPLSTGADIPGAISLAPDLPAWARLGLYLPPLQLLGYHRAISKSLDPDAPRHLSAVVFLDRSHLTPA